MELRPPGTPIDDPFFAAVRRRHPDVDLVVLPSDETTDDGTESADPVDDATVARVADLVAEVAAELWSAVAPDSGIAPTTRVRYAEREADVRAVARVVEQREDGFALLVRLLHELDARGWFVQRPPSRPGSALERIVAELDGGHVVASCSETGTVVVELASVALPVGVERARELVR
jgi:hypothetical protein